MPNVTMKDATGKDQGSVDLDEGFFGIEPNVPVMHQVVTAQLAARRSGTQSTKTRAEVRGGGAKPWKQKGTGRARQGSTRSPQWKGGGVALGPKPRSYEQRTPKKMIKLALRSALSDRAAENQVIVVDQWSFDGPSTKQAVATLDAIGAGGRVVVVVRPDDAVAIQSFRNLPYVHLLEPGELNAYDILCSDVVVFTSETLPGGSEADAATAKAPKAKTAKPAKPAKAAKASTPSKPAAAPTAEVPAAESAPAVTEAPGAPDEDPAETGGDQDMASDLPTRAKPTGEAVKPVDPAERVKPAGEKTDPRFEAARVKAEKEAQLRASREQAAPAAEAESEPTAEAAPESETAKPKSGGFSFSQTSEPDEDAK